jgi:hypothetical protein
MSRLRAAVPRTAIIGTPLSITVIVSMAGSALLLLYRNAPCHAVERVAVYGAVELVGSSGEMKLARGLAICPDGDANPRAR